LLVAEILAKIHRAQEAEAELRSYQINTRDAWYHLVADGLLHPQKENLLVAKAGESPEFVLTGHVALAFWAESAGDKNKAIDHYREALGSYMDDMIEYDFAVERIKSLRRK
jgi:hypothetical protein